MRGRERSSGSSAPTTPGSPPRRWSRRSSARRASSRHELGREALRRAGLGVEGAVRRPDRRAVQAARRLLRLRARALHPRRGLRRAPSTASSSALYDKGYIYRDNYMVNWDPGSHSAISDLEVENREVEDTLYSIDYPVEGSDRVLTVATVRPETMLADTAVAVNPGDERYARPGRPALRPAAGRPPAADHRRRARRPRVRHRRAEDHPRPRPQRLRDRPRARARGDLRDRRGRADDRGGRERFAGLTAAEAQEARRRRPARGGPARAARSPTPTRCPSRTAPASGSSR